MNKLETGVSRGTEMRQSSNLESSAALSSSHLIPLDGDGLLEVFPEKMEEMGLTTVGMARGICA